jgi:hypothetical protein
MNTIQMKIIIIAKKLEYIEATTHYSLRSGMFINDTQ